MIKKVFITTDLTFGDAGKGATVDALVRNQCAGTVIRFNGGAQAAHNVIHNRVHHTFAQFGSGTMVPGVKTILSKNVLVNPLAMILEERALQKIGITDAYKRMYVHSSCVVTTPFHCALNRIKELIRGDSRHGSCGMGIGETVQDKIDCNSPLSFYLLCRPHLTEKLRLIRNRLYKQVITLKRDYAKKFEESNELKQEADIFVNEDFLQIVVEMCKSLVHEVNLIHSDFELGSKMSDTTVFEAAQGVLLHEDYGFAPYNTWSDTSMTNANNLLRTIDFKGQVTKMGIIRSYLTRHGPGPFVTESTELSKKLNEKHNTNNVWQREFRAGWLDIAALKYALKINGHIDYLVVNHVDQLEQLENWNINIGYSHNNEVYTPYMGEPDITETMFQAKPIYQTVHKDNVLAAIKKHLNIPIAITGHGANTEDRKFYFSL